MPAAVFTGAMYRLPDGVVNVSVKFATVPVGQGDAPQLGWRIPKKQHSTNFSKQAYIQ